MAKKYFWLKLKDDFFDSKEIKKLRRIAGGDTYTIIYLKMLLKSVKTEGRLCYEKVEDDFADEISLDINEDVENVRIVLAYLEKYNLIEVCYGDYLFPYAISNIGQESDAAERMRRMRETKNVTMLQNNVTMLTDVQKCYTEIEKDKEIKKKKEKNSIDFSSLIESYTNDTNTITAINEFIQFKKDTKHPFVSETQFNTWLKKLDKHKDKVGVIEQSIANGWQGLFELKQEQQDKPKQDHYRRED